MLCFVKEDSRRRWPKNKIDLKVMTTAVQIDICLLSEGKDENPVILWEEPKNMPPIAVPVHQRAQLS